MSLGHAARTLALGRDTGIPVVLSAAVRHADPKEAATVDVLDAARRLVALDVRHLDRVTTAGHLAPSPAMYAVACDVAAASGPGVSGGGALAREAAQALLAQTVALADECVLDPAIDLGIGAVHLPEPTALGLRLDEDPQRVLAQRCRDALPSRYPGVSGAELERVTGRLEEELGVIAALGYPTYFLTVATVTDLIREMRVRVAARGSGAGSLVNYLLGISGVDPIRYDLLMERFCTTLRAQLPDIDIDVESARRTEIYEKILARFGGERVTCVSMMDSYRVRHAIRDVGAALGLPPAEVDAMAKAFPHVSARYARSAIADLPELRVSGLGSPRYDLMFDLVERLDGLPRHIAVHPCGVILSNSGLLDRTPVEASWMGFPMSQFDKDDVEVLGLLKLDVLGIRMQSAMAHAVDEVARVDGIPVDLDDQRQVPLDDEATFRLIRTTHTLGCFQIESPGQRELIGKFGPERFEDLVIDISLFRPGPVKSDMIVPFLNARQGWADADYLHPTLVKALAETEGVVVFHEQILLIVAETTGVTLAEADEVRRALGSVKGQAEVEAWWRPAALARGYSRADVDRIWAVLAAFASFGFCKAHAAAFALPTYQSAWLKTHHPAAFFAGVLTHDPGMYPKRLILDDARSFGIEILGLDVNASKPWYAVERVDVTEPEPPRLAHTDLPDARGYGIRISLADVKGITEAEIARTVAGAPYATLADFWRRAHVSRPVVERLVLAGGFDSVYGLGAGGATGSRDKVTRRDLLLHVAELDRWFRSGGGSLRGGDAAKWSRRPASMSATGPGGVSAGAPVTDQAALAAAHPRAQDPVMAQQPGVPSGPGLIRDTDITALAAAQTQAAAPVRAADRHTQLTLDLGDTPQLTHGSGLPELTGPERVRAELEILGLDASAHVVDFYAPMLHALGVVRSRDLLDVRSRSEVWVAGVKVATQTPP
ncbi:MAG: DNA polymerase III subunit alpha, partial [Dermatophilaceae bacterium]